MKVSSIVAHHAFAAKLKLEKLIVDHETVAVDHAGAHTISHAVISQFAG